MSTITREFAQDIIKGHGYGVAPSAVEELARVALASLEAEAVAWTDAEELRDAKSGGSGYLFAIGGDANKFADPRRQMMLYTAPPAPIAMKDHQVRELVNELRDIAIEYHGTQQLRERIARTVRAAMLQSFGNSEQLKPVSPRYKLPDGYVAVPIEPTESMIIDGFESEPDEFFSKAEIAI